MSRNKLLCIDLRWIQSSGVGTYIQGIMPGLVEMLNDVEIVGIGDRDLLKPFAWSSVANFSIAHSLVPRYSFREQIEVSRLIPKTCDLFFSPYYTIPLWYPGPLVVTVHDMSHRVVDEIVSNPRKRMYAQLMYWALARRAAAVFTVSDFSKAELLRLTNVPAERVTTTHLGIEESWYQAGKLSPFRKGRYFVVVGNIKPYKNLPRLLEAFLSLTGELPHDLVIIGQGEGLITGESSEFFQRVRAAGSRVVMTGKVSFEHLQSLVGHAEALLMPSLYEGFGLPPLEAMAAGVPAVVSKAGSLPEVCGDAALYFNPLDVASIRAALRTIATEGDIRRTLSQAGTLRSEQYRWEKTAAITADVLRRVLETNHSREVDSRT